MGDSTSNNKINLDATSGYIKLGQASPSVDLINIDSTNNFISVSNSSQQNNITLDCSSNSFITLTNSTNEIKLDTSSKEILIKDSNNLINIEANTNPSIIFNKSSTTNETIIENITSTSTFNISTNNIINIINNDGNDINIESTKSQGSLHLNVGMKVVLIYQ